MDPYVSSKNSYTNFDLKSNEVAKIIFRLNKEVRSYQVKLEVRRTSSHLQLQHLKDKTAHITKVYTTSMRTLNLLSTLCQFFRVNSHIKVKKVDQAPQ